MKPSLNPTVAQLDARIQLLKNQLQEWKALAGAEREAHRRLREQHQSVRIWAGGEKRFNAFLVGVAKAQAHLELSARYSEERSRMRQRHQQQEAELAARSRGR